MPRRPAAPVLLIYTARQDAAVYKRVSHDIEEWLPKVKGVVDIVNQTIVIGPSVNFRVDMEKAQRAGFTVKEVGDIAGEYDALSSIVRLLR